MSAAAGRGNDLESLVARFTALFGVVPTAAARAPGRVNLIGDHTDYCGGLALPMAIDRSTTVLVGRGTDDGGGDLRIASEAFPDAVRVPVTAAGALAIDDARVVRTGGSEAPLPGDHWSRIPLAVLAAHGGGGLDLSGLDLSGLDLSGLDLSGLDLSGLDLSGLGILVANTIPIGAGLSSSAGCSVALSLALDALGGATRDPWDRVDLCRDAEEAAVGVPCGILDPTALLFARAGHALLLDCAARSVQPVAIDLPDARWWVVDTRLPRTLASSGYAERRAQCERAAELLAVPRLGTLDESILSGEAFAALPSPERERARHVVTEDARVRATVAALDGPDPHTAIGALLRASHDSLRDDHEVSHPVIDHCIERARALGPEGGIHGVRMTGGGFGGALVLLADAAREDAAVAWFLDTFRAAGCDPAAWPVAPSAGASVLPLGDA